MDKEAEEYRFERTEEALGELLPEYYSLYGSNLNDGEPLRMCTGESLGVHVQGVEIPRSGSLEFTILEEGNKDKVLAPRGMRETSKLAEVVGPMPFEQASGSWCITGAPGSEVTIELLSKGKAVGTSVMWYFAPP